MSQSSSSTEFATLLGQIADDYAERQRRGEAVDPGEYAARYPHLAEVLRQVLPLLDALRPPAEGSPETFPFAGLPEVPGMPVVPGYEIERELGRGGMGVVYLARQAAARRVVALKMILAGGHAGPAELARFQAEAEAIAALHHPGIVQVFEVGTHQGLPYFSLEYCPGGSLGGKLGGTPLPADAAAETVRALAEAMAHAHARGVVHRDLKPANVLLDAEGRPKVTDFGLARRLDDESGRTATGAVMGTPSYMAPEQAEGRTREVGPACDVWALGAILYECLTGRPPFRGPSIPETLRQVREAEPAAPRVLNPSVPRDLETICLKCLRKEPTARYTSAQELADDLGRFLAGEPIRARPVGAVERSLKWVRRNPVVATLAAAVVFVLLAGVVVSSLLAWKANHEASEARQAQRNEKEAKDTAVAEGNRAKREEKKAREREAEAVAATKERDRQLAHAERSSYAGTLARAVAEFRAGNVVQAGAVLDECQWDLCDFEHGHLRQQFRSGRMLAGHKFPIRAVAASATGRVASASLDTTVKLRDADGSEVRTLTGHTLGVLSVGISADGTRVASGSADKTVRVWDADAGTTLHVLKDQFSAALSGDGKRLVTGAWGEPRATTGTATIWDTTTGRAVHVLKGDTGRVMAVALSGDGRRSASTGQDATVRVWDAASGQLLHTLRGHRFGVVGLALSGDGKRLASCAAGTGREPGEVKVWDTEAGREVVSLKGLSGYVFGVALSPDGRRVAVGTAGDQPNAVFAGEVKVFDAATGQELRSLRGHKDQVLCTAFSADGRTAYSGCKDGTVGVWPPENTSTTIRGHASRVTDVAVHPDGTELVAGSHDGALKVWDARTGRELRPLGGPLPAVSAVAYSPDGRWVAVASLTKGLRVLDAATGAEQWAAPQGAVAVVFRPGGRHLAGASTDGAIRVWEAATGREVHSFAGARGAGRAVAYSRNGTRLAGTVEGGLRVWDADTADERYTFPGPARGTFGVAFAPDAATLYALGGDGSLYGWELATRQPRFVAELGRTCFCLAVSPDGRRLAVGTRGELGLPGEVVLLDAATGQRLLALPFQTQDVYGVAFTADGTRVVAGGGDYRAGRPTPGEIRVWEAAPPPQARVFPASAATLAFSGDGTRLVTAGPAAMLWDAVKGRKLVALLGQRGAVHRAALSPDGTRVVTGGTDTVVRVWDARTGAELRSFTGHAGTIYGLAFAAGSRVLSSSSDGTLHVWDAETGAVVRTETGRANTAGSLAVAPDGRRYAEAARNHTVEIKEVETGRVLATAGGFGASVLALAFSPDGKRLLGGGTPSGVEKESPLCVWDAATGKELLAVGVPAPFVAGVAYAPDGKRFAVTAGKDVTIRDAETGQVLARHSVVWNEVRAVAWSPVGNRIAFSGTGDEVVLWSLDGPR